MKLKILKSVAVCALAAGMTVGIAACGGGDSELPGKGKKFDNENDPLVFSTEALDGVFSPFFATSGTDSAIASMTQIGLLANDNTGRNVTYGEDESVVALDYWTKEEGKTEDVDLYTTYYFALKNDVKFSDGSPLTIKDVLFNFYVYLDPAYYGSSTIYSTDIVGLKEYRTQAASKEEQDAADAKFTDDAQAIIKAIARCARETFEKVANKGMTSDDFRTNVLGEGYTTYTAAQLQALYDKAIEFFKDELNTDYSNSIDSATDIVLEDSKGKTYKPFKTDVEAFLYNEGYLTWNKETGTVESSVTRDPADVRSWTKDEAINRVYDDCIPSQLDQVVQYWAKTPVDLLDYETAALREEYYDGKELEYKSISGIQFANRDKDVTNPNTNTTYKKIGAGAGNAVGTQAGAENYNTDGSPKAGFNEVLSIKIRNRDPKAVWNFGIGVAPMWYYSNEEQNEAFDYEEHFGLVYSSREFMDNVIKDPDKTGVPVGAGPYAASTASGGITQRTGYGSVSGAERGTFYHQNVVYFERNPEFNMAEREDLPEGKGPAKIKKVRFQVAAASAVKNALYRGEIDYVEPKADTETYNEVRGKKGAGAELIQTNGYGYIGVNAGKVPELKIRQAIMHAINVKSCVDYYKGQAEIIYRSMSKESWAYPDDATAYYPYIGGEIPANLDAVNPEYKAFVQANSQYIEHNVDRDKDGKTGDALTKEGQYAFIRQLVSEAGYVSSGGTSYVHEVKKDKLEYRFTVVGSETDHPAWNALIQAGQFLNDTGCFKITTKTDAQGLSKLGSGDLTVWAAAWGSTIDPDMYQVYHRDSAATSTWNWGYREIKQNKGERYDEEQALLDRLSEEIDKGRKYLNPDDRKQYYETALTLVMQLAIELPTYQRKDLFAWNDYKLDGETLYKEANAFLGLTSQMYNMSLRIS